MISVDGWDGLARRFPLEVSLRDDILAFIGEHPGCGFNAICNHFRHADTIGLMDVLFRLREDGDVVTDGPHPVESHYLREVV